MYIDEKNRATMDGFGVCLAIGTLKTLAFVYDIITFPIYVFLQRPWRKQQLSKRVKAIPVDIEPKNASNVQQTPYETKIDISEPYWASGTPNPNDFELSSNIKKAVAVTSDATSITYRSLANPREMHIQLIRNQIDTMEKAFRYICKLHNTKNCLGTRKIINEEDEIQPNGRIFKKYNMGEYQWKTFTEVDELATNFGRGLRAIGCQQRQNVVIFAETRAEWMIAAQALFKQNIALVTIYATLGDEAIAHGVNETEVDTVITSYDLLEKFKTILPNTPKVKTLIYMEDQLKTPDISTGFKQGVQIIPYKDVIEMGKKNTNVEIIAPVKNDTAIIMYTSGSTGIPKGVILTHGNLIATMKGFADNVDIKAEDILIGFLPLAHVFELLAEQVCLLTGVPIGYSTPLTMIDSSSKIKKGTKGDASILKPTCMTAVPLILDRVSKGVQEKVSKGTTLSKILFKFAYEYKTSWISRGYSTPLLDRVIFSKVKSLLGGRIRLILTGGAPLSPDTHELIRTCICERVIQGYGLTETTSMATVMDYYDMQYGRVGGPTTMCDVRIVDWEEGNYRVKDKPYPRGELIIGGENIAAGYYKLPEKTKEEFFEQNDQRWFKTGDIGEIHHDGVIKIIDRKKDLVKLQAGEYVSLGKVEAELKTCPLVENICVYGDSSKQYTVCLVVPNPTQLEDLATKNGVTETNFESLCSNPIVEKAVLKELADHGKKCKLEKFELPAAAKLCTEVWSPDMGLVTAAFKLKRKDIQERYQHEINRMYAS